MAGGVLLNLATHSGCDAQDSRGFCCDQVESEQEKRERDQVSCASSLRACYPIARTDIQYGATRTCNGMVGSCKGSAPLPPASRCFTLRHARSGADTGAAAASSFRRDLEANRRWLSAYA
eukprot:3315449-Rhodomonas_salina.1